MKIKLIDFWAEWCGPCKILSPFIDQIKEELSDNDNIEIIKVNVDQNPEMAREYSIRSIPTILLINSETNEIIEKIIGMQPKNKLLEIIKEKLDQ